MSDIYPFQLGSFRCWVISDGQRLRADPFQSVFVNVSDEEMRPAVEAYVAATGDPATLVGMNILVLDTGLNRVVVDTGNGLASDVPFGNLLRALPETGLKADDIDTVIITHGHGDHIGGCTDGNGTPSFPNARYILSQIDWDHWSANPREATLTHLFPIVDRLERVATNAELVPGIRAIPAPGHSPGLMALLIESDGDQLLHVADTWHYPVQIPNPDWYLNFDWNPEQAIATRREMLALAAQPNLLVLPYHATFPGLGRVISAGDELRWQPLG